jgi:hypothetical protein
MVKKRGGAIPPLPPNACMACLYYRSSGHKLIICSLHILYFIDCGYKTWPFVASKQIGPDTGCFVKGVPRRKSEPKRKEVAVLGRKLHNEVFHNLHSLP